MSEVILLLNKCTMCGDPLKFPFNQCSSCVIYFYELEKEKKKSKHAHDIEASQPPVFCKKNHSHTKRCSIE